jgi:hypothetical protein
MFGNLVCKQAVNDWACTNALKKREGLLFIKGNFSHRRLFSFI